MYDVGFKSLGPASFENLPREEREAVEIILVVAEGVPVKIISFKIFIVFHEIYLYIAANPRLVVLRLHPAYFSPRNSIHGKSGVHALIFGHYHPDIHARDFLERER